ncbi:hypothetical protein MAM1_0110c05529 [Mucor ambiguus]|uniref:Zn(2)-C6 fungal-type domain-containing protein n=1 Tax=Mucor ambiguus TaxID=91626 RepID=A0A0C9MRV5_9FUNG|nr:hypothetical protein MAM1_0110c05529 [Mucor ambiguus]
MTGTLRWHSCSTNDFPLKRHKVSKACEACRSKKMRCDGKNPCQRCESNRIKCKYNDKPARSRAPKPSPPPSTTQEIKHRKPPASPPKRDALKSDRLNSGTLWISNKKLHKIAFKNQLYETLKFKSLKTRRYGLSLPPLLVGFFDITSQSTQIWTRLIELLNQMDTAYMEDLQPIKSNIVEEAFRLFVTHNLVYGAFIHAQLLSFVLDSNAMLYHYMRPTDSQQQHQNSSQQSSFSPRPSSASASALNHRYLPYFSIIIYSILAITFLSAYLVLPNTNCSIPSENLYLYSHIFYREAHKQFLETCFPTATSTSISDTEPMEMMFLVQASILLAHFQCQAISEEQAYMTIRIGLDFAQRCSLTKDLVLQDNEDQGLVNALLIALDSWYAWLSFYLGKPYSERESIGRADTESKGVCYSTAADGSSFFKKSKEHQWALHVTDVYTLFLKDILLKSKHQSTSFSAIKDYLKLLQASCLPEQRVLETNQPYKTVCLYNDILTIQLASCHFDFTDTTLVDASSMDSVSSQSTENTTSPTIATANDDFELFPLKHDFSVVDVCIQSSKNILSTVYEMVQKDVDGSHPVPSTAIYATCLVSQLLSYFQRCKRVPTMDKRQQETIHAASVLYKHLLKLLKYASNHVEALDILLVQLTYSENSNDNISKIPSLSLSPRIEKHMQKSHVPPSPSPSSSSDVAAVKQATTMTPVPVISNSNNDTANQFDNNMMSNELLIITESNFSPAPSTTKTTLDHLASATPPSVTSRLDIDREQLEKLSRKPPSSSSQLQLKHHQQVQQQMQQQRQQYQQYQKYQHHAAGFAQLEDAIPVSSSTAAVAAAAAMGGQYYYYSSPTPTHSTRKQQQLQQYNNSFNSYTVQPPYKRFRSDTVASYEDYTGNPHGDTSTIHSFEDANNPHRSRNNSLTTPTTTAATDFIDVDELTTAATDSHPSAVHAAAAAAVTADTDLMYWVLEDPGTSFYPDQSPDQHQQQAFSRQNRSQSTDTGHHSTNFFLQQQQQQAIEQDTNNHNNANLTKLPLPHPSKPTSMPLKTWSPAPAQYSNKFFFASEVQTLHYQTPPLINFENSSFPIGLNVIHEEEDVEPHPSTSSSSSSPSQLLCPPTHLHHRASITSDKSSSTNGSSFGATGNSNNSKSADTITTVENVEAVAVAAAKIWASTAAALSYSNADPTAKTSTASPYPSRRSSASSHYHQQRNQYHQTNSKSNLVHYINNEKVGNDEY